MADMSQDEKVATLASISGNEDLDYCRQLLEAHDNDLETAVNVAIGVAPHAGRDRGAAPVERAARRAHAPRPGPGIVHPNPLLTLLGLPVRLGVGIVSGVVGLALNVVGGVLSAVLPPGLARRVRALPAAAQTRGAAEDPIVAALEFRRDFAAAVGAGDLDDETSLTLGPDFLAASHRDALREAQRQLKFLFVYLHSHDHVDAHAFCADVLCDPEFKAFVDERVVCWAGDVRRADAHGLAVALRPSTFPYAALLQSVDGRASLVMACEGATSARDLADLMESASQAHAAPLAAARAARAENERARSLRDEQDAAFRESLEADARREAAAAAAAEEAARLAEEEARAAAEEAAAEAAAAEALRAREALVARRRLEKSQSMKTEPAADAAGVCKVAVKLPSGGRRERRFLETDTLRDVFDFVDALDGDDAAAVGVKYSLVSNFPRRVFGRERDADVTLGEGGLAPQAMLMYRLDDDE
jgi:FAS-associated factor 2